MINTVTAHYKIQLPEAEMLGGTSHLLGDRLASYPCPFSTPHPTILSGILCTQGIRFHTKPFEVKINSESFTTKPQEYIKLHIEGGDEGNKEYGLRT